MRSVSLFLSLPILAWLGGLALHADAIYQVTLNTPALAGESGYLAFDLLGGIPLQDNVAIVSDFSTDGALGSGTSSGDVAGSLVPGPLTLTADQFFNEWLQPITLGVAGITTFQLDLTTNYTPASAPDSFSFFVLDQNFNPIITTDPSGADALFAIDLVGSGASPDVFDATDASATLTPVTSTTPEPVTATLAASGIALMFAALFFRRRRTE